MDESATKPFVVDVVITARNQAEGIAQLVREMPARTVRSVLVIDNGSADATARVAEDAGAIVLREGRGGHGAACLRAVAHLSTLPRPPDAVAFMNGDGTADPADLIGLLKPLREGLFDLVVGSRALGAANGHGNGVRKVGRAGSFLAVSLIHAIYGHRYTDLGPLRAIRYPALIALGLSDLDGGFLAEMQVKAVRRGLRIAEVPVRERPRHGSGRALTERAQATGQVLYQILRHATAR
jgi:glycosyltransferase involved in cell wall biosynthesis